MTQDQTPAQQISRLLNQAEHQLIDLHGEELTVGLALLEALEAVMELETTFSYSKTVELDKVYAAILKGLRP